MWERDNRHKIVELSPGSKIWLNMSTNIQVDNDKEPIKDIEEC